MLRAMRALKSVGSAIASSKLLVCSDWVPPSTAASASIVVRMMLLYGSCSVRLTPLVWQWVRSRLDFVFLRAKLGHDPVPQRPPRAQLGDLHEQVHADAPEEAEAAREIVDVEPVGLRGADIFHAVGERVGELLHRRRSGLVHVIAADRDRVELGHLRRAISDDVADDPHARLGRVDVGVADRELFQNVVLDRAGELGCAERPAPRRRR